MFDRTYFLYIYYADPVKWAKKYDIEPFSHPCKNCGRLFTTTIPFFQGQFHGLIARECECGSDDRPPYCMVRDPKYGDLFSGSSPKKTKRPKQKAKILKFRKSS